MTCTRGVARDKMKRSRDWLIGVEASYITEVVRQRREISARLEIETTNDFAHNRVTHCSRLLQSHSLWRSVVRWREESLDVLRLSYPQDTSLTPSCRCSS